jgi:hypothetical protein
VIYFPELFIIFFYLCLCLPSGIFTSGSPTKICIQISSLMCLTCTCRFFFYGERLLGPCPTLKLDDHLLPAVCAWFSIYHNYFLHLEVFFSIHYLRMHHTVLTKDLLSICFAFSCIDYIVSSGGMTLNNELKRIGH